MKLIDLTHVIDPENTPRKFSLQTIGADEVNKNVVRTRGQWYIMSDIHMVSHIATHVEVPYHLFKDGDDLASMPLEAFCGEAVVIDLSSIQKRVPITCSVLSAAIEKAGGIKKGDIVFCNLGYSSRYGTPEYQESPYFSTEAINLLVESGMKMMGVDAGGVEVPQSEEHVNHAALFSHHIPLIENVANFDALGCSRFFVTAFPYPMKGVEAFPVRVVAIM